MSTQRAYQIITLSLVVAIIAGCGDEKPAGAFYQLPDFVEEIVPGSAGDSLQPVRLQMFEDTLFVSYNGVARIDKYSPDLRLVDSILLTDPEPIKPTSFVLIDSLLVIASHARHLIVLYDREGHFRQSFGTTPDGRPLSPFALDAYGGVAYIGDLNSRRVLAVSLVNAGDLTERGELILTIPSDSADTIAFPSAVRVTYDGRLLVGDATSRKIKVFTCDGRYVYDFEPIESLKSPALQGFDRDNVIDPRMQDSSSFDPSGIRNMGRFHAVDATNRRIHMFNSKGKYVASYPEYSTMEKPSGIAIDRKRQRIFVADPAAARIFVFGYER